MKEVFNIAPFVTLGVFILGILFTPLMRKWEYYLSSSKSKKILYVELSDCKEYLKNIAIGHFKLLHKLETQASHNGEIDKVPVPIVSKFDLDFLKDFYKECITILNVDERHLVRGVPEKLSLIFDMSGELVNEVRSENFYNKRAVRNILWASCSLYCEITELLDDTYKKDKNLDSIESTRTALNEFGFSAEDVENARALKSMLNEEQRNSINSNMLHNIDG